MEPVVGIDVAKGFSVVQAFTKRNERYGKSESISHGELGFNRLGELLTALQAKTGVPPVAVFEATGHYHRALANYLARNGWTHYIINPLQSKRAKATHLRKVKTDATDACHLADMYYRGDVTAHRTWEKGYTELQHVTRQHEFVTGLFVQSKLNARALLEQVFPAYTEVFSDLFSATALKVLKQCLSGKTERLAETIVEAVGKSHSKRWIQSKTEQLERVLGSWDKQLVSQAQTNVLNSTVCLLLEFVEQLRDLEQQMNELAGMLPEVELVKSIPGIGNKLAAALVAEIGDVKQFEGAKQLVAFAGLDPGVCSSGQFVATSSRITKRGSKRLRRSLYLAVQCGLRKNSNSRLRAFYDKKRKEGKPYKVVVIACANKLLHHVYAILSHGQPFKA